MGGNGVEQEKEKFKEWGTLYVSFVTDPTVLSNFFFLLLLV